MPPELGTVEPGGTSRLVVRTRWLSSKTPRAGGLVEPSEGTSDLERVMLSPLMLPVIARITAAMLPDSGGTPGERGGGAVSCFTSPS